MRKIIPSLLFILFFAALSPVETAIPMETIAVPSPAGDDPFYPMALAAGALAGVATVNVLTYGVGVLPLAIGTPTTAPIISPAAAAASRIFVITSGVIGAWIVNAFYPHVSDEPQPPIAVTR